MCIYIYFEDLQSLDKNLIYTDRKCSETFLVWVRAPAEIT